MRLGVDFSILNQKGTPAFYSDIFANRPAYGFAGRVFISTDTGAIYEDTGSAWTLIADAGAGTTGTLQQVTTNGNTTSQGLVVTAGNVAIGTATAGAPLDIHATGTNAQFNGTGTNNAYLQFQNAGANKWRIGNTYAAGSNNLDIYNNSLASNALSFNLATNAATFNNSVTATSLITSGGTSAQFVKGNGSLDSGTYLPITGGISTDQILKVYSSGGNFYLGSSTISDNGTSVTINGRITSNSDTISVNGTAGSIQMQINNQTATTGKQWYLNSKSTGILGIGNNTASDVLTFASTGTATFLQGIQSTGTADQMLQIYGSSPSLRLYNTITSPTITGFVGMATGVNNFILGSASGDMCIGTSTAGKIYIGSGTTTVSPAMTILSSGNVGINITTPTETFVVNGSGRFTGQSTDFTTGSRGINIDITNTSGLARIYAVSGTGTAGDLALGTNNVERMRITTVGDLIVGGNVAPQTSSGRGNITINGSSQSILTLAVSNTEKGYLYTTGTDMYVNNSVNGGRLYAVAYNNGVYLASGGVAWIANSDERLKTDLIPIENALNKINTLRTVIGRYKTDEIETKRPFLIAQDLLNCFPEVVNKDEKTGYLGVSYTEIIPLLIAAIKELNDKLVKNNIN
jgi:hypothetical protein